MGVLADGLRLAVGTLTAVPVRAPAVIDRRRGGLAMMLAPLAVLPLALVAGLLVWGGAAVSLPPLVVAGLVIAVLALGSRALHLDGLADTADGLTASYDRAKALDIMTRGNTGPAGAAALVLVLGLQMFALASVVGRPWAGPAVGAVVAVSRGALVLACRSGVPAARPGGLGATVAGTVPAVAALLLTMVWVAFGVAASVVLDKPWWQGLIASGLAIALVAALVARCTRRLGGITGDVLGAAVELSLLAHLLVLSAG